MPTKKNLTEVIAELKRELSMRKQVYPKWIQQGKITRSIANHQYLCLQRAIELIADIQQQATGHQSKISL